MAGNYIERLRRLAISAPPTLAEELEPLEVSALSAKTMALARLAALVAVGGATPSFGEQVSAAVSAGATSDEIVDVLVGISSVVGAPRVVDAAPKLALALGFDVEDTAD